MKRSRGFLSHREVVDSKATSGIFLLTNVFNGY